MITYTPFKAEHLLNLELQDAQAHLRDRLDISGLRTLENEWANTLCVDGRVAVCAGFIEIWPGRAMVWSFLGKDLNSKNFLEFHNIAKRFVDLVPYKRLEAYVRCDFKAGHRWIKALGFKQESACMEAFEPDGSDHALYSKIKG